VTDLPPRPLNAPITVPPTNRRQGVVDSITTLITSGGNTVLAVVLDMGGLAGPVRVLEPYVPVVGDTVELLEVGGDVIVLGKLAGAAAAPLAMRRVATAIVTSDSGNVTTTETAVISVVAPVVDGRTYRITFEGEISTSQTGVFTLTRIRADSATGDNLMFRREYSVDLARPLPYHLEAEFTHVDPDEDKTFVFTLLRETGTGNHWLNAAAAAPAYMYVDLIR
jgi:hypothetical protein